MELDKEFKTLLIELYKGHCSETDGDIVDDDSDDGIDSDDDIYDGSYGDSDDSSSFSRRWR